MRPSVDVSPQQTVIVDGYGLTLHHLGPLTPADLLARPRLAIVGARASTSYGNYVARDLAIQAVRLGYVVISGGAYGIDAAAHTGALAEGGSTVAVLGCGVDTYYPRGNEQLLQQVRQTGAIMSEYSDGSSPGRMTFLARNRIIAMIAQHVIVVEAALRSGSLNTAEHALTFNRKVYAVPGQVGNNMSAGTNDLLKREGVRVLTGLSDLDVA